MTISQIESNIQELISNFKKETFIYDLLLSYGLAKSSITRLKKGSLNLSKIDDEIIWKKKVFYREELTTDLHLTITEMEEASSHNERFIIVTDFKTLLSIDTKTNDRLDIDFLELPNHYDFFLPWAGMEKANHHDENPADVRAAVKMAKLFDEIRKDNPDDSPEFVHSLNVFLSRLLFCFFAEDTHIFEDGQFTNSIDSHTQEDGSDLDEYLNKLFSVLNTSKKERPKSLPKYLSDFPFVNGGLFREKFNSPKFTRSSRKAILASGDQNWSAINPDIFGSMFQAVVSDDQRGNLGQHYTSVPNIMKVIRPLFLDEFYEEFERSKKNPKKLIDLLNRLGKIKIFDPACGSGNFLIIAYKELRRLEIKIIQQLLHLQEAISSFNPKEEQLTIVPKTQLSLASEFQVDFFSRIQLTQFYGIEIDDFAHEIAKLALWLAEHQMNIEFRNIFGKGNATLPLKEAGNIVCTNACRIEWEDVCPNYDKDEIYILGNPPFLGTKYQLSSHKEDMKAVFLGLKNFGSLDYVACWFMKGANYIKIKNNTQLAFVSTNSLCQGTQVGILWPNILDFGLEIGFAYQSFKWKNRAKDAAGVTCVIVNLRNISSKIKFIYNLTSKRTVNQINPYLISGKYTKVNKRSHPLSNIQSILYGSKPVDDGNLILSSIEKEQLIKNNSSTKKFIKRYIGSQSLINNIGRWCIWISDDELQEASLIPELKSRMELVKKSRLRSKKVASQKLASESHRFGERRYQDSESIIIPVISSELREYIPIGYLPKNTVINANAFAIYSPQSYLFGLLSSLMHIAWVKAVGGRMETRLSYINTICYNAFPFPHTSDLRIQEITQTTFRILEEREKHPDKTLAELYDPDKMPDGLRAAHEQNDIAVERCYRSNPFESDEERLEHLFRLYEKMIAEEEERDTLFTSEKKTKRRK